MSVLRHFSSELKYIVALKRQGDKFFWLWTTYTLCSWFCSLIRIYFYSQNFSSIGTLAYGRCSKISNTSCLPKRPRQTAQTPMRFLKKQSDQGLPCLLF